MEVGRPLGRSGRTGNRRQIEFGAQQAGYVEHGPCPSNRGFEVPDSEAEGNLAVARPALAAADAEEQALPGRQALEGGVVGLAG